MNIEEKAKAYDEAIKRGLDYIRQTPATEMVTRQDIFEAIFPEYTESEDERIRKEISNLYSDIDGCITELLKARTNKDSEAEGKALFKMEGIMVGTLQDLSCIEDYLEKQKEQKQSLSERIRPDFPAVADFLDSVDGMEKNKAIGILEDYLKWAVSSEEECRYTWKELADAIQLGIDAMKEQKPAEWGDYKDKVNIPYCSSEPEWSEEDKDMLNSCISSIEEAKENRYAYKETDGDTSYDHEIAWLKSLPGRFVLQPKQEWSEDDERVIRDACNWIAEYAGFLVSENKDKAEMLWKLSNKLKSLCPQSKQEWSDKDDHILNNIYDFVAENTIDINRARCAKECLDWLKSLRPQPKAELTLLDENIIEAAVAFVEQNDHFNCWGGIDKRTVIKALHSLKPSWKPSEEQMEALKNSAYGTYQNGDGPALRELYEQLKKLM